MVIESEVVPNLIPLLSHKEVKVRIRVHSSSYWVNLEAFNKVGL